MTRIGIVCVLCVVFLFSSGCVFLRKAKKADELEFQVEKLKEEISELEQAKRDLAESLQQEIGDYKAKLEMTERGLVITFLAEVFFDSGKDLLREDGKRSLAKVAAILNRDVPNSYLAVEGHTDADPIKHSAWKSNWELSAARALAVLHFFIDQCNVKPSRLSANAYGEFRPIASNKEVKEKQQNRRVEIVILPSEIKKIKK